MSSKDSCRYPIPAAPYRCEQRIKNSRFIASVAHTDGREAANAFIAEIRATFPDAGHHCSCFVAGAPGNSTLWGRSDDGEPAGTAGRPMLEVLSHAGIGEVCVVVSRYFGGTKLGTGGLVRAYSGAVKEALAGVSLTTKVDRQQLRLTFAYDQSGAVEQLLSRCGASVLERAFTDQQKMLIEVEADRSDELQQALAPLAKVEPG